MLVVSGAGTSASADVVRAWFERLNDTFGALVRGEQDDMEALLDFYDVPLTMTTDDEHRVLRDRASIVAYLSGVAAALRQANYERTVAHRLDVRVLNARSAIIDVDVSRLNKAGGELARFGAIELVSRTEEGWRVSAVIVTAHHAAGP
jgi:hypothetical protein